MGTEPLERKLAAILYADVAGYSRLTGEDEEGTHRALSDYLDAITASIERHRGKVLHYAGDAVLAEFASVVDALTCAVDIQHDLKGRNEDLPDDRKVQFRIGINLGDVIVDRNEIYGDGVNVAARLETLAAPGGICISESVRTAIGKKLPIDYEFLGEQEVKNITEPVKAYSARLQPGAVLPAPRARPTARRPMRHLIAATAATVVLIIGVITWWQPWQTREEPASVARMAFPLPDEPSIAILPFDNLSGDPNQEYFSDGLTNDIITDLSKFAGLFVIASKSSFAYKNKPVKVQTVSEELGVRYILEGSVQKSGSGIRINAQLIDALTGRHLWAERYDSDVNDLFAAQDEIVETVVAALAIKVDAAERERASRKDTDNLAAYDYYLRGADIRFDFGKEANERTRQLLEKAVELDPNYARAHAALTWTHVNDWRFGWSEDKDASKERALELARKAIDLDPSDAESYWALGVVHLFSREFDKAMPLYEKAVSLNRNDARLLIGSAPAWVYVGRMDEAIAQIQRGMRLNPYQANTALGHLGWAYYDAKEYEKALSTLKKISEPAAWVHRYLAATYVRLGRLDEARAEAAIAIKNQPDYSIEKAKVWPYQDENQRKHYNDAIVQVGIPEKSPLPLPDKPSIAVLPFDNLSGDSKEDAFTDGITENIITALAKIPNLFVIARHSSFTYKGKAVKVKQVAEELGVRYVLEGSLQRSGDRVRVSAQLIDALSGHHLWAERYDRNVGDIFALQDEITLNVVTQLEVELTEGEKARMQHHGTESLEAVLLAVQSREYMRRFTKEDNRRARELAQQAIELDPKFAEPYGRLGWTHYLDAQAGWSGSPSESFNRAVVLAQKALKLDDTYPDTYLLLGALHLLLKKHDEAIAFAEKGVALRPNQASNIALMAFILNYAGEPEKAIALLDKAMRLSPYYPDWYLGELGRAYILTGQYSEAIAALTQRIRRNPNNSEAQVLLAAAYGASGQGEQARTVLAEFLKARPGYTLVQYAQGEFYKNPEDLQRMVDGLRKAGLTN